MFKGVEHLAGRDGDKRTVMYHVVYRTEGGSEDLNFIPVLSVLLHTSAKISVP